jgi:hypothetical protein
MPVRLESWFCTILFVVALTSVQGCSSFRGAPKWDPKQTLESTDALYDGYLRRFFTAVSPPSRVSIRNEYIAVRLAQIDRNYGEYKQDFYSQRVGSAVAFDLATLGLAGTAAAVADVGTKTGASALAALLTGSKTSIDKNVYFDRTLPAMVSQMDGLRSVARARLFSGMLLPDDRYSLSQADSDLTDYRQVGTLYGAVSAITTQAGQAQVAAEKVMRDRLPTELEIRTMLTGMGFVVARAAATNSAKQLQKCVSQDGILNASVAAPLRSWLATVLPEWIKTLPAGTLNPSVTPESDFLSASSYEPLRQQALSDVNLGPLLNACN